MESVNYRIDSWKMAAVLGVLFIIVGILMIALGRDSLKIILIVTGVLLIISGALYVLSGATTKQPPMILVGVVGIVLGIILVVVPNFITNLLMVLLAIFLIIGGAFAVFTNLSGSTQPKSPVVKIVSIIVGIALVVLGIVALFNINTTGNVVMIITGIVLLLAGCGLAVNSYLMYKELKA